MGKVGDKRVNVKECVEKVACVISMYSCVISDFLNECVATMFLTSFTSYLLFLFFA